MMYVSDTLAGSVVALWRYPVKSMQGEELNGADVTERGILGDRAYAIVERATGHIASAKHPRKWSRLFECRAAFVEPPRPGAPPPPVWITLPDGAVLHSARPDVDRILSRALGRDVVLTAEAPRSPIREANRAPIDDLEAQEVIEQELVALAAPAGTFFDYAPLHLLTTATTDRLRELHPSGRFEARRFRPNIVVAPAGGARGFVENAWLGCALTLGPQVQVRAIDPCPRCLVTTLPQGDLPRDPNILRVIGRHNVAASATLAPGVVFSAVAGIYAGVLRGGALRRGDSVWLIGSSDS
jgi:uncharacterized protein YcbX